MIKLQSHTTSGASGPIQSALVHFDFAHLEEYLQPIRNHLRSNANLVRNRFREVGLETTWYQTNSAFFFLLEFVRTPYFRRICQSPADKSDYSEKICQDLLKEASVALVPGKDFGRPNSARMSLVIDKGPMSESLTKLLSFLTQE